jgi:hypothetical protein
MNKIDLIIDALESAYEDKAGWCDKVNEALYAAHELKALKPVGYGFKGLNDQIMDCTTDKDVEYCIPLYALEVTK